MQGKQGNVVKNLAATGEPKMYKRHTVQVSMLESPEMFGSLPLDPKNDWVKLSKLVPWQEFDLKYAENFRSKKGQRTIDSRMALGALLIKPAYRALSDEDIAKEIAIGDTITLSATVEPADADDTVEWMTDNHWLPIFSA